jgi:predicted transcriptional regulator
MGEMSDVTVRSQHLEDQSDAIILSIEAKWIDQLKTGTLKWLMRKRIPASSKPKFVYLHAKAPVSAIFAKARIERLEMMPAGFAIDHSAQFAMTAAEVRSYLGGSPNVGVMKFGRVLGAKKNADLETLRRRLNYHPPQSFSFVSREAAGVIDGICGF